MNTIRYHEQRNYGIDLAKWVSMFMVVTLHNLLNGGVLLRTSLSLGNLSYWFLENICIVGVNVFALISGFLIVNKQVNMRRLIKLWKVVVFWSVVPTIFVMLLTCNWNLLDIIKSFFPFVLGRYWYFNAYVGLFLCIPFLNVGIQKLDTKYLRITLVAFILISSTVGMINNFFLESGYSVFWLVILYLVGAYVRMNRSNFKKIDSLMLIFVIITMASLSLIAEILSVRLSLDITLWISYNSPFVIVQSLAMFILFERIELSNNLLRRILIKFTPLTFSVYLIDSNITIYKKVIHSSFEFIRSQPVILGHMEVLLISTVLFVIFILCDYLRLRLFKLLRLE